MDVTNRFVLDFACGAGRVVAAGLATLPPARREAMSQAALTLAETRFDLEKIADEWDRTYRELLERSRPWM